MIAFGLGSGEIKMLKIIIFLEFQKRKVIPLFRKKLLIISSLFGKKLLIIENILKQT